MAATVLCWGAMPVFLRELTYYVDAWTANGLRYPFAAILYWPILVAALRAGRLDRRLLLRALVPAFFSFTGQILWALSPYYLPASLMGLLVRASILWALLAAMVLFPDERYLLRSKRFLAGLACASGGVVAISIEQGALGASAGGVGILIVLGCGLFFGLYGVSVRWCLGGVPSLLAFGVVSQYVSAGTISLMLIFGAPAAVPGLPAKAFILLGASSFLGIALSHFTYYVAIHRLGAARSSVAHLGGPFVTILLATLILGERLSAIELAAGAVLLSGLVLVLLAQWGATPPSPYGPEGSGGGSPPRSP